MPVNVRTRTAAPSRGAPTETGTAFVAGKATAGPTDAAVEVRSIADVVGVIGDRATGNAGLYDWLDTHFREGGFRAFIGRYTDTGTLDAGLALFNKGLGPGQLAAPDATPGSTTYSKLLDHAEQNDRYAICDVAQGDTVTAMETLGDAYKALPNCDYGLLVGPWHAVPAAAGVLGGSARSVPASAATAALCARVDALGNPNRAAAGRDFPLWYVTGFDRDLTDDERAELLDLHAVNTFGEDFGLRGLFGFQTGRDEDPDDPFWQANCGRARMWLKARAFAAGKNFEFRTIDGRGRLQNRLKGVLDGICLELYAVDGLFGETPQEAFATEVGVSLNTTSTIAQGELNSSVEARLSLHAKTVNIDLVSVPVNGRVSSAA
jgi:hypothetical protein